MLTLLWFVAWEAHGEVNGINVETQPVANTTYEAVRLTAHSDVPPEAMAEALWQDHGPATKEVQLHQIVEETRGQRLFYEIISAPVTSDRDALVRSVRGPDRITFASVTDTRRPVRDDRVRMTIKGSFDIKPANDGGSIVIYEVFTDLGGSLPGWMVNKPKREAVVAAFSKLMQDAYLRQQRLGHAAQALRDNAGNGNRR